MINNILKEAKARGISDQDLCKILGKHKSKIYDWKKGRSEPTAQEILLIAEYFNVSADYLLTGKEPELNNSIQTNSGNVGVMGQSNAPVIIYGADKRVLTKEEAELLNMFDEFDVQRRMKLLQFAFDVKNGQNDAEFEEEVKVAV